jgi:hypothetical protein
VCEHAPQLRVRTVTLVLLLPPLCREAIVDRVYKHQGRPMFPPGCPPAYVELATELWAADYHARPVFRDVITRLHQMLAAFQSSMAAQAAAAQAAGQGAGQGAAAVPGAAPAAVPTGDGAAAVPAAMPAAAAASQAAGPAEAVAALAAGAAAAVVAPAVAAAGPDAGQQAQ